jgi:cysteinyl-tRNA synthetase
MDLIFPHHEDEIAQSESAVGHRVVGHWVHGAHLLAEGRKMSKSSQNFFDLRDLEARGHSEPLAFRLLCLQTRYRAQMNFTWDALDAAERTLARWRRLVAAWPDGPAGAHSEAYEQRFRDALSADLDTPAVVALISDVIAAKDLTPGERGALLRRWDAVLALDLDREPREADIPPEAIELVERRQRAREDRDWATADRLRVELGALGVEVDDTPDGPKARRR